MKPFDQLAKDLLQTLLATEHVVQSSREVRHEAQQIDVFSAPHPPSRAELAARFERLGWLARMAASPACFEAYAGAVRRAQLMQARRRQFAAWHELCGSHAGTLLPMLWLLSPAKAPRLERHYALAERRDWPTGFRFANAGERWCLVVIPDLPGGRATLPLRALGRGAVQRAALHEIAALPVDDPLRSPLTAVCARNRIALPLKDEAPMDPENLDLVRLIVEQRERELAERARNEGLRDGRNEGLRDGRNEGRVEGLRVALRTLLAARGLTLPREHDVAITECQSIAVLERWVARAAVATDATDLFETSDH